jgi:NADH dehydrogenase [ubiquinone] 1 alpha subcomplex assembly factor 6
MRIVRTAAVTEIALDPLASSLRRHDRDRYLTTLFAPADRRAGLVALYGLNFEVAKTREVVREPLLGRIRLQWWREAIDEIFRGATLRHHEVVAALAETIRRFDLTRYHFDRLLDAREADLDEAPAPSLAAFERYAEDTSSRLVYLALEILGSREPAAQEAGRHVGIAWAFTGLLRALPAQTRMRRATLPRDVVAAASLDERVLMELKPTPSLADLTERLAGEAHRHLAAARQPRRHVPRRLVAALLPATLAQFHLRRLARARYDPFDPRLARPDTLAVWRLAHAALTGRY